MDEELSIYSSLLHHSESRQSAFTSLRLHFSKFLTRRHSFISIFILFSASLWASLILVTWFAHRFIFVNTWVLPFHSFALFLTNSNFKLSLLCYLFLIYSESFNNNKLSQAWSSVNEAYKMAAWSVENMKGQSSKFSN